MAKSSDSKVYCLLSIFEMQRASLKIQMLMNKYLHVLVVDGNSADAHYY